MYGDLLRGSDSLFLYASSCLGLAGFLEGLLGAPALPAVVDLALKVRDDLGGLLGAKEGRSGDDHVRAWRRGVSQLSGEERGPQMPQKENEPARAQQPMVPGPTPPSTWMSFCGNR